MSGIGIQRQAPYRKTLFEDRYADMAMFNDVQCSQTEGFLFQPGQVIGWKALYAREVRYGSPLQAPIQAGT